MREAARAGELREDFPALLVARAFAGLTGLALVLYRASEGAEPTIEQIPDLVLQLVLDGRVRTSAVPRPLVEADLDDRCGDCGRRLLNMIDGRRVARALGPILRSWPGQLTGCCNELPIISSDLLPAVRRGDVVVKPAVDRVNGDGKCFVDASEESVDHILVRGARPASIREYAWRLHGYAAARLAA